MDTEGKDGNLARGCHTADRVAVSSAPTFVLPRFLPRFGAATLAWCALAAGVGAAAVADPTRKSTGADDAREARPAAPARRPAPFVSNPALRMKPAGSVDSRSTDQPQLPVSPSFMASGMDECWERLKAARRPSRLVRMSEACERDHPDGAFAEEMRNIAAGAGKVLEIQHAIGLSGDFFEDAVGDATYRSNLDRASRGDKDAAYLMAMAYRVGTFGVEVNLRRMEQWLQISAGLGSGLASWELAEYYNYGGRVADAARFEKRALDLGYKPAFRLPTRGY